MGTIMQNKPNFHPAGPPGTRDRAKRTQLGRVSGGDAQPTKSRTVQNEPNSRRRRVGRGLGGEGRGCCTNKPNFGGGAWGALLAPRPSDLAPAKPIVPNKPNWHRGHVTASRLRAKSYGALHMHRTSARQSQSFDCGLRIGNCGFRTELRRDAPCGLPPPTPVGQMCKTNPISATPGATGIPSASLPRQALPVVQNHGQDAHATGTAVLAACRTPGAYCAKRTQFLAARRGTNKAN